MTIDEEIIANPILREVCQLLTTPYQKEMLSTQTAKGIAKYPNTVSVDDYSIIGWIDHNVQKLIDSTVYYKALKKKIEADIELPKWKYYMWLIDRGINSNIDNLNDLEFIRNLYLGGE
ncbi:hypothetical protein MKY29_12910 [Psychrobacillus sp. FSL K6-2365]|uniref:hypothetical protein n=1 Tax=Psychrobacillus sp. FSL K6-2365 TaxID=2921546 RepID=UPI0030F8A2B1